MVPQLFTVMILKTKYKWGHYLGAGIIMTGIFVSLYPQLTGSANSGNNIAAEVVFFSGAFPSAASAVYKEVRCNDGFF